MSPPAKLSAREMTSHGHLKFFQRPTRDWNLAEFVKSRLESLLKKNPKSTSEELERTISASWMQHLNKISTCKKCSPASKNCATTLMGEFRKPGSSSHRGMGKTALASLIENDPLFNINIINNGNDNVVNFACGDQYVGSDTANDTAEQSLETDNDDETTRVPKSTVHHDEEFRDIYRKFVDDRKWALPSGTTVEDTLYEAYFQGKLPDNVRKSIRCWTVLVGNQDMQDLFKPVDWAAILEEVKPLPPINDSILHYLARFRKVTTSAQLRKILQGSPPVDQNDPNAFDLEWVRHVFQGFLILYERNTLNNVSGVGEHWFDMHLWGPIIDKCMLGLSNVHLNRADLVCQAYVLRKNRNRTDDTGRLKTGLKADGLFHDITDRQNEYGVMECAKRLNGGESSSKWRSDQGKMRKLMRDIIGRLAIQANNDRRVVDELQVIGISTAGFSVQVLRMTQPKGYTCLLKSDKSAHIPQSIRQFSQLPFVLSLILKTRLALALSIEAFRTRSSETDEQDYLDALEDIGEEYSLDESQLPFTADTP